MKTVYLIDITGKGMNRESLNELSDQEFIKMSMTHGSIYSLEHFAEEYNSVNPKLSMVTNAMRII